MNKIIEIPDIAQWEETDSELAKKNIIELSSNIKYHIDFNKKLIDEITRLNMIIDIKNKRIDELNKRLDKKNNRIDKAIERYCEENNIIPNIIEKEKLDLVLKLGIQELQLRELRGENND